MSKDMVLFTERDFVGDILRFVHRFRSRRGDSSSNISGNWIVFERKNVNEIAEARRYFERLLIFAAVANCPEVVLRYRSEEPNDVTITFLSPAKPSHLLETLPRVKRSVAPYLEAAIGEVYNCLPRIVPLGVGINRDHIISSPRPPYAPLGVFDSTFMRLEESGVRRTYSVRIVPRRIDGLPETKIRY